MNKEERIKRYGEEAYERVLEQNRKRSKNYKEEHPEEVKADSQERNRKGGKHYAKTLKDNRTGLRGERQKIRTIHARQYKPYKQIIAPESQIHHEWVPDTAEYRGLALVEKEPHQYGIIDVIQILDGNITLLTEEQVRKARREPESLLRRRIKEIP